MKITAKVGQQIVELTIERQNGNYVIEIDGERRRIDAHKLDGDFYSILTGERSYEVSVEPRGDGYYVRHGADEQLVTFSDPSRRAREAKGASDGKVELTSMMPGKVVRVLVAEGDTVEEGQGVVVVEAMKMENEVVSPRDGRITRLAATPGQTVEGGALLAVIE